MGLDLKLKQSIAAECYSDPGLFCKTFLAHWFPAEIVWYQRGILAILTGKTRWLLKYGQVEKIARNFVYEDGEGKTHSIFTLKFDGGKAVDIQLNYRRFTLLMIPRGFSKTTINNAANLYKIVYREVKVGGYLSETSTHAENQLMNIRRQLETNVMLREVFGDMVPGISEGRWTSDLIEPTNGVKFFAKGRNGQVRGTNFDGERPGHLTLDDVEDKESVQTQEQREKSLDWAYSDVFPALSETNPNATIVAMGTLLHSEALLMKLRKDPQFISVVFEAVDRDGEMLWPFMMDREKYELRKASFAASGQLSKFYLEYHNSIRNDESAKFKAENIVYAAPKGDELLQTAIALDPAISEKRNADFAAIGVVSMSNKGSIYLRDIWMKRGAAPREQIDEYFRLHRMYDCQIAGVESIAFQAALIHLMREEMFRKKRYFEIKPITHKMKKEERVEGILQPRYANKFIKHVRRFELYEGQLLDWPHGKMDGPDVVAMAISLLDPFAANASSGPGLELDVYEPLEITEYAV